MLNVTKFDCIYDCNSGWIGTTRKSVWCQVKTGPNPIFLHYEMFLNENSTKFRFLDILTKPKVRKTHSSAILTITGTVLGFLTLTDTFLSFLTLTGTFLSFLTLTGTFLSFLTLTGTFISFLTLTGIWLSFLTLMGKQSVEKMGLGCKVLIKFPYFVLN